MEYPGIPGGFFFAGPAYGSSYFTRKKSTFFAQKSPETSFLASHHGKHSHVAVLSQTAAGTESTDSPQRSRMLNLSKKK
jgi:hypothetical protein